MFGGDFGLPPGGLGMSGAPQVHGAPPVVYLCHAVARKTHGKKNQLVRFAPCVRVSGLRLQLSATVTIQHPCRRLGCGLNFSATVTIQHPCRRLGCGFNSQRLSRYSIHAEGWAAASTLSDSVTIQHPCRRLGCGFNSQRLSRYSIHAEGWAAASTLSDSVTIQHPCRRLGCGFNFSATVTI